jgi:Uma2 family endonuclease
MSTQPKSRLTPEEYLAIERKAEYKSEYYHGEMFAMAGAKEAHNLIVTNAIIQFGQQFRSRPCRVYPSDMRVCVDKASHCAYPDAVAVCGDRKFLDGQLDTLLNPNLIVAVLSPSTEACDRGRKFESYQSIESLREYLLVSSGRVHADLYSLQPNSKWQLSSASPLEDAIGIPSLGCVLRLADLYDKVEF